MPGMLALALATVVIAVLAGGQAVVVVIFLSLGFMAMGLADGLRWRWKPENAILIGGMLAIVALILVLIPFMQNATKGPVAFAEEYLRTSIAESQKLYTQLGLTNVAQVMAQLTDSVVYYLVRLLPAILLATTLLQAACCYGMARALILRKDPAATILAEPTLSTWHAPDPWVWGLIVSLGLVASGLLTSTKNIAYFIGLNLALLYLFVYAAQGVSLVDYWLRKAKLTILWRSFIHTIILTLPPLITVVIAFGVVDIWADFRKVRMPTITP